MLCLVIGSEAENTGYSMKAKKREDKCLKNKYGNKKLMNQEVELQYCFEHAGRTCCNNNDINSIRSKMY